MIAPLADCEDCGAGPGVPCDEACPSRAAAELAQIELDLDNPPERCNARAGICICGEDSR